MPLTDYERGKLTLQAFGLMDGWGTTNEKGAFLPHNLEKRKELAVELVKWATTPPLATSTK